MAKYKIALYLLVLVFLMTNMYFGFSVVNKTSAASRELVYEFKFGSPTTRKISLVDEKGSSRQFDRLQLGNLLNFAPPGEPSLPWQNINIVLPPGTQQESVEVETIGKSSVEGSLNVEPGQTFTNEILQQKRFTPPKSQIYEGSSVFPPKNIKESIAYSFRGIPVVSTKITPFQYSPREKKLSRFTSLKVKVKVKESTQKVSPMYRGSVDFEELKELVDNPLVVDDYLKYRVQIPVVPILPTGSYTMVIISSKNLIGAVGGGKDWADYAVWRTARGIPTTTYSTESIAAFSGTDTPMKIRNFIIAAYQKWGIKYVLLGGDTDIIPTRLTGNLACAASEKVPTDMYFSCLDGNWNADGDATYGEMNDGVDLWGEVYVGRVSLAYNNPTLALTQLGYYYDKAKNYDEMGANTYHKRMLFIGEQMNSTLNGGQHKDDTIIKVPINTTTYSITKMYSNATTVSSAKILEKINGSTTSPNVINHVAHGNCTSAGVVTKTTVDGMTNANRYFIYYTWACLPAAFHPNSSYCPTEQECLGEKMIRKQNAGAVAFIGNSHFGWFDTGAITDTVSHAYEIRFYKRLLTNSYRLGKSLLYSKHDLKATAEIDSYYRWTYYALHCLGDPSLSMNKSW